MSKQRPSKHVSPSAINDRRAALDRSSSKFWRKRIFRNTYTRGGRQFVVAGWSVKIQFQGTRQTLSLRSDSPVAAAAEAQEIYQELLARGWKGLTALRQASSAALAGEPYDTRRRSEPWQPRLVVRKYVHDLVRGTEPELSARVEHGGLASYFPLETSERTLANKKAREIFVTIRQRGWETAHRRYSREVTVALRWFANPVAWTYTTLRTQVVDSSNPVVADRGAARRRNLWVAIFEPDAGIRRVLARTINRQSGFECVAEFGEASQAVRELGRRACHLVLMNHSLPDMPAEGGLRTLQSGGPGRAVLIYSVYEDSDQLTQCAHAHRGGRSLSLQVGSSPKWVIEENVIPSKLPVRE